MKCLSSRMDMTLRQLGTWIRGSEEGSGLGDLLLLLKLCWGGRLPRKSCLSSVFFISNHLFIEHSPISRRFYSW